MSTRRPIIVIGAGWAGLSAALTLARRGETVTLLEAAPQAGGRAREIPFGTDWVDNGQHLLVGAYPNILKLLEWLQIPESSVLHRASLTLLMRDLQAPGKPVHLSLPTPLTPLRLLWRALTFKGLSFSEGLRAVQFFYAMHAQQFRLPSDLSIQTLLESHHQPQSLIAKLWEPLALAALSTPIQAASAQVFLSVLQQVFFGDHQGSHALFPTVTLSQVLPNPILETLGKGPHGVFYHQRVQKILIENGECTGVLTATGSFKGKAVILATPPHVSAQLLQSHPNTDLCCQALIANLLQFSYQPITTVYLRYANAIQLPTPMIGILNGTGQWIFDRTLVGQPNLLSVVMTSTGPHSTVTHASLIQTLTQELAVLFPHLSNPPLDARVVTEKKAAFSCHVGIEHYRPSQRTPVTNLLLAGDYTEAYYPATLESAVQSGIKAAQLL